MNNGTPDSDWAEKGDAIRRRQEEASKPTPFVVMVEGKIQCRDGYYFIDSRDVCRSGFQTQLEPDTLIQVGRQIFEVCGYSDTRREYWLVLFDTSMVGELAECA